MNFLKQLPINFISLRIPPTPEAAVLSKPHEAAKAARCVEVEAGAGYVPTEAIAM
jgi:hypothetical protein